MFERFEAFIMHRVLISMAEPCKGVFAEKAWLMKP